MSQVLHRVVLHQSIPNAGNCGCPSPCSFTLVHPQGVDEADEYVLLVSDYENNEQLCMDHRFVSSRQTKPLFPSSEVIYIPCCKRLKIEVQYKFKCPPGSPPPGFALVTAIEIISPQTCTPVVVPAIVEVFDGCN